MEMDEEMDKDGPSCVKVAVIVAGGHGQRIVTPLLVVFTTRFYNGKGGMHLKKIARGCFS
jgi:hypothetical protein